MKLKKKMTPRQTASVFNHLEAYLYKTAREGYVAYKNGCTDKAIAEKIGVNEGQVASIRRAEFGKITTEKPDSTTSLKNRLDHIENSLEQLDLGYVRYGEK